MLMKKILTIVSLYICMIFIFCNNSFAFQNEQEGFRKLKFGMSFRSVYKELHADRETGC